MPSEHPLTAEAAPPTADDCQLLRARIEAAIEDVRQAERALEQAPIDSALAGRVDVDFADALRGYRKQLTDLGTALRGGKPIPDGWVELAGLRVTGRAVLAECLAYINGALARSHGIGSDLCELADRLVADVSCNTSVHWGRFTMLAEGEFVGDLARIIRLRFPDMTLWSLPMALHELGHHVMPRLGHDGLDGTSTHPFAEMLATEEAATAKLDPFRRSWNHLNELLADAFATYTGGPAFGLACAFLRFVPQSKGDSRHPPATIRMYGIVRGLRCLAGDQAILAGAIDELDALWLRNVEAAGVAPPPADPDFDAQIDQIHALLDEYAHSARFDGWLRAQQLAETLADADDVPDLDSRLRPWDVINAGWLARLRRDPDPYGLRTLADVTADVCRAVLVKK